MTGTSTVGGGVRDVFATAQECFLRKDLEGFAELFAEDGVHELPFAPPGVPGYLKGRERIKQYLTSIEDAPLEIREFIDLTVHDTADPDVILAEYTARGIVTRGKQPYEMRYVQLLRVENGRIAVWRDYWSPLDGMRALGVLGMISTVIRSRLHRAQSRRQKR